MAEIELNASSDFGDFFSNLRNAQTGIEATGTEMNELNTNITKTFDNKAVKDYASVIQTVEKRIEELNRKLLANPGDKSIKAAIQSNKEYIESIKNLSKAKDGDIQKNNQVVNSLRGLQQEYKRLVQAALEAGQGTPEYDNFIRQAGIVKDRISDIRQETKNLGSDTQTFDALAQGATTVASAFQLAQGTAALFGTENEDLTRTLVQLNAIMAITNGLQNIGNALQAQSALRLGIARAAAVAYGTAQKLLGRDVTTSSTAIRGFNAALSANAVGAVLLAITTIVTFRKEIASFFTELPQKFGILGRVFQGLLIIISGPLAPLTALILAFDRLFSAGKKATTSISDDMKKLTEETEENTQRQIDAITRRYDTEIALLQAVGKSTLELEKLKQEGIITTLKVQERQLQLQISLIENAAKLSQAFSDQLKDLQNSLREVQDQILDSEAEITINEAQAAKERNEASKKALEERRNIYRQAADEIIAITRQAAEAELSLLTGEERIEALRASGQRELDEIRRRFQAANEAIAKATKDQVLLELSQRGQLTSDQYEALRILTLQLEEKIADETLELQRQKQQARIDLMADGDAKELEQLKANFSKRQQEIIDQFGTESEEYKRFIEQRAAGIRELELKNATDSLALQQRLAEQELELLVLSGMSEEEATRYKEQRKLEIIIEFARKRAELLQTAASADGIISPEEQAAINEALIQVQNAEQQLIESKKKTEEELLKIDLAKALFPGLDQQQLDAVKDDVKQTYDTILGIITDSIDQQIDQNQRYIDSLNTKISETQSAIEVEAELAQKGLANNLDAEKANLAKQKEEREKALAEQKKLQEQKNAIETVNQVVNLISASAQIFNSLAGIPFVGIPLAIAAIAAMFGAFAATKAQAASAASSGFHDGGHTGTGNEWEVAGPVHKDEYVINKKKTKKNRLLLDGIHFDDPIKIHKGIEQLLENTGISLTNDKPLKEYTKGRTEIEASKFHSDSEFVKMRKELVEIKEMFAEKIGIDKGKPEILPGNEVKKGNVITKYR